MKIGTLGYALLVGLLMTLEADAGSARATLWTGFTRAALQGAKLENVQLQTGTTLSAKLEIGAKSGRLETSVIAASSFDTAIVSWNTETPTGTSLLIEARARFGARWTKYYRIGTWSTDPALPRTSFDGEKDDDARVSTDTLVLKRFADALQIRVTLSSTGKATPTLTGLASITSNSKMHKTIDATPSNQNAWGLELSVPTRSQMIYPDGGPVWCSPTSITMMLEYWSAKLGRDLAQTVPQTAKAVWDDAYDGAGNWPFNTAYAASRGVRAYVNRLSSLREAEVFIARGVPLALSVAWGPGELEGSHIAKSDGHLVVLRGFAKNGDPIINDPAAKSDAGVRTVYRRAQLERAWVGHSGGVVYVLEAK
jgi:Peptidase_C39 like family